MVPVKIRRVDALKNSVLLNDLQRTILPHDKTDDVSVGYWWIACFDGNAIGFCALKQSNKWSDCGYLSRAGVLPEYRGQGIQKRLIKVRERQAKKLGWHWLISDTYRNPASANSLISCGFKMYNPSEPYGATGTCYWRKRL